MSSCEAFDSGLYGLGKRGMMLSVRRLSERRRLNCADVRERTRMGKIILYIAISLDGFIARRDGDIAWLTAFDDKDEDYGYAAFYASLGAVILGGKTYRQVLGFGTCLLYTSPSPRDRTRSRMPPSA